MAAGKRPALPLLLTASDLLDGEVVYYDGRGWSRSLSEGLVATDDAAAQRLEQRLAETEAAGAPVAAYLMTVILGTGGTIVPDHYRERIRCGGPTVRPDLGPQAKEACHVSL